MLKIEDVLEVVAPHIESEETIAELKLALMEKDVEDDMSEIDNLKAELEAERNGRADDKAAYDGKIKEFNDRFDRFIHGKEPVADVEEEVVDEVIDEDAVVEDPYEELYGGNE